MKTQKKTKNSFTRSSRLTERADFVRFFDQPNVFKGRVFILFWLPSIENKARLGITMKGKFPNIWRTRIKRRVREWFRTRKELFGPVDINVVVKSPTAPLGFAFVDELMSGLEKWIPQNKSKKP